ncbi:MAG: orotate phosphoribosyltransferase [Planctomycetes bacterium]|nr:orotate phosphoribosyltransferase [Planctomycetota bacterium]
MTSIYPKLDLIAARARLLEIVRAKAYREGRFVLSSGKVSDTYLDCRLVTLDPEGLTLFARLILQELREVEVTAVGGLTLGADPIAAGVAVASYLEGRPLRAFIVRKEAKAHGAQRTIEGELAAGERVAIVDDVMTTGGSVKQAIAEVEKAGAKVAKVLCLVDREEGGSRELIGRGYDFAAIFSIRDVRSSRP